MQHETNMPAFVIGAPDREPILTMHHDGRITYVGAPDDATQRFLDALGKAFPEFVKRIARGALEHGAATIDSEATRHNSLAYADCSLILRMVAKNL